MSCHASHAMIKKYNIFYLYSSSRHILGACICKIFKIKKKYANPHKTFTFSCNFLKHEKLFHYVYMYKCIRKCLYLYKENFHSDIYVYIYTGTKHVPT